MKVGVFAYDITRFSETILFIYLLSTLKVNRYECSAERTVNNAVVMCASLYFYMYIFLE